MVGKLQLRGFLHLGMPFRNFGALFWVPVFEKGSEMATGTSQKRVREVDPWTAGAIALQWRAPRQGLQRHLEHSGVAPENSQWVRS